jgi:hypothetical protein
MAKLQLRKVEYQSTGEFNYENLGTVASNFKGMSLRFTNKNLASEKRVNIIAKDKSGEEYNLPLSAPLSGVVRKALANGKSKKEILAAITKLDLYQDGEKYFVFQPQGEANEEFLVDNLASEKVSYDEMVEW